MPEFDVFASLIRKFGEPELAQKVSKEEAKLLKGQGDAPRVMVTDKLRSYDAAKREIMPSIEHRSHKGLNNRAENSHQPIRRRERIMKRSSLLGICNASSPSTTQSPISSPSHATIFRQTITAN